MKVEFRQTPSGEVAIIPRAEYDRLKALSDEEAAEDIGTAKLVARAKKDKGVLLPLAVVQKLAKGENPIRVLRKFRGLTKAELATAKGVQLTQNYLSDLEKGRVEGPIEVHRKLAKALKVPLDFLTAVPATEKMADAEPSLRRKSPAATLKRSRAQR
jgi:transcriptional regulator with XRE-family HTH domain